MNYKKITNLEELNKALDNEENNFVIANGALRSSKWITYGEEEGTYEVLHLIDDSTETITASELFAESIESGVCYIIHNSKDDSIIKIRLSYDDIY